MNELINRGESTICIIGLGYVGLPLAIEFAKRTQVFGFDINGDRLNELVNRFNNVDEESTLGFVSDLDNAPKCDCYIVTVPTPVDSNNVPNLNCLEQACYMVGKAISNNSMVIFESTVFPGATEEICIPILEESSGLKCGIDFKVGYSPERINPGDKVHTLTNTVKLVSGVDDETVQRIVSLYSLILEPDLLYATSSIKVAEAAKILENCQRDVNIAFMNEMALIFSKLGIDHSEVADAAKTKWNFLQFYPGLVGGHCIGIDPYYLIHRARGVGHESFLLSLCRSINESLPKELALSILQLLSNNGISFKNCRILVLGYSFKKNSDDIRNTKVEGLLRILESFGANISVIDPLVDQKKCIDIYSRKVNSICNDDGADVVILCVAHDEFLRDDFNIDKLFKDNIDRKIIIDIFGDWRNKGLNIGYLYHCVL